MLARLSRGYEASLLITSVIQVQTMMRRRLFHTQKLIPTRKEKGIRPVV